MKWFFDMLSLFAIAFAVVFVSRGLMGVSESASLFGVSLGCSMYVLSQIKDRK